VLRWPKRYRLLDQSGELRKAWQITRGKRSWSTRNLYDMRSAVRQKVGEAALLE